jgi:hypothetical protein
MVTEVREWQSKNADFPIVVTLFPIVTEFREEQKMNAKSPMEVRLFPMVAEVIKLQL